MLSWGLFWFVGNGFFQNIKFKISIDWEDSVKATNMLCKFSLFSPLSPYTVSLTCESLKTPAFVNVTVYTVVSSFLRKYKEILEKIILSFNRFLNHHKISTHFKYSFSNFQTEIYFSKCNDKYKCNQICHWIF